MPITYTDLLPVIKQSTNALPSGNTITSTDSRGIWTVVNTTGGQITYSHGFDKDSSTYLSTSGTINTYIEIRFPSIFSIGKYKIQLGDRSGTYSNLTNMASWDITARVNGSWVTIHSGTNTQTMTTKEYEFEPIEADRIRINCKTKYGSSAWGFTNFYLYEAIVESINKTLILNKNEYKKWNSGWQTVSSSTPSQTQFLSDGIDSVSTLLDRKVQSVPPIKMNKSEILLQNGKLFSKTIELKAYTDIRSMKVEVE